MAKKRTSLKNIAGGVGKSPLQAFGRADPTLVRGARLASYYSGGSSSTTAGEANTDLIFDPAKKVLEDDMKKKEAAATMEKCIELGGEWDYVNSKCSKDDKDDKDGKVIHEGTVKHEGDIGVDEKVEGTVEEGTVEEGTVEDVVEEDIVEEDVVEEDVVEEEKVETNLKPKPKPKTEEDTKEQIQEGENALSELNQSVNLRFTDPKANKSQDYTNPSPTVVSGLDKNHPLSRQSGGGDINGNIGKSKTHKDGKIATLPNSGKANGVKYNMDTKFSKDGKTITFKFIEGDRKLGAERAFGTPPYKTKGEYTVQEWDNLVDAYRENLNTGLAKIMEANATGLSIHDKKKILQTLTRAEQVALRMHSRGFTNLKISEVQKAKPKDDSPTNYKEQSPLPMVLSSPFRRRDMSSKRIRDKWRPSSQPTQPLAYSTSPLHKEEIATEAPIEAQPPTVTLWDKIDEYGGLPAINSTVENFISNVTYNPEFDKPLKAIQSGNHNSVIQKFADDLASQLKEAGKNKDMKGKQNIMGIADQLVRDVSLFAEKFMSWTDIKGGDKTPGNIGGDMTSKGSDKTFDFNQNTIMMGDPDVNMGITPEGKIHFKRNDIPGLVYVGDMDKGIFHKNYEGIKTFAEAQKRYHGNGIEGLPLNDSVTEGTVSGILQTKDALLSWAHDENAGKSWVSEYAEMNQGEDLSWAMPESEQFDYDRLYDEVHGWMSHKLNEAYNDVSKTKAKKPKPDAAKQILSALQAPVQPQQPQQPQQQEASPIAYKSRAQQLIEKYS